MKTSEQRSYLIPEIEVNEMMVEQGFAVSNPSSETMPEIGEEKDEIGR